MKRFRDNSTGEEVIHTKKQKIDIKNAFARFNERIQTFFGKRGFSTKQIDSEKRHINSLKISSDSLNEVFSFLNGKDLVHLSKVSKEFKNKAQKNWNEEKILIDEETSIPYSLMEEAIRIGKAKISQVELNQCSEINLLKALNIIQSTNIRMITITNPIDMNERTYEKLSKMFPISVIIMSNGAILRFAKYYKNVTVRKIQFLQN
jgi:hypothetical protein